MECQDEGSCGGMTMGECGALVERKRLVRQVLDQLRSSGVVFVCAPTGFGKTALLIQCASAWRANPESGAVELVDARGMAQSEFIEMLDEAGQEGSSDGRSLLAIDNLPSLDERATRKVVSQLRGMRERGRSFLISCTPKQRSTIQAMGDSAKVNASSLMVRPFEYAKWVNAFGISSTLDVYQLTQGIPSLVLALRSASGGASGNEGLEQGVLEIYRSVMEELRLQRDPLLRLLSIMVMMGHGSISDMERAGMKVRVEQLARLKRDYPIISYDVDAREFACLGSDAGALGLLRGDIVSQRRSLAMRAVKVLIKVDRVDDAVGIMERFLSRDDCLEIIEAFPTKLVIHGHAAFVMRLITGAEVDSDAKIGLGAMLASWLASLCTGNYRAARAASANLRRQASQLEKEVDAQDWDIALAMGELWKDCKAVDLPELSRAYTGSSNSAEATRIRAHVVRRERMLEDLASVKAPTAVEPEGDEVVIPHILDKVDACLIGALTAEGEAGPEVDRWMTDMVQTLHERKLAPFAVKVRVAAAVARLMAGRPMVDERAFTDASRVAVRESNLGEQLFCLTLEGWMYLSLGQAVNAEFRAQQVQKLAGENQADLTSWAYLLERVAALHNSSRLAIRQEAEVYDLSQEVKKSEEAWAVALHLSAARYDADLSAWYSMHRALMLRQHVRGRARLALHLMGEQADSMRRLLPRRLERDYLIEEEGAQAFDAAYDRDYEQMMREVGQVSINLFGGFHALRNGHILTEEIWKRRKATFLAARLALGRGTFINRQVIMEELWPDVSYVRARQNLYVTLTALRQALCQHDDGPQYIVSQAGALALNEEYVSCDLARFDMLARDVLLKRTGISSRQIVETCLKVEEIYKGPLFVPEVGDVNYFARVRDAYASKFVDCMVRGVDAALDEEDVTSAAWLIDAAIKQAPTREDVMRRAMKVMNLEGRRREIVELYNSHLYYLQQEMQEEPEEETKALYRKIIESAKGREML